MFAGLALVATIYLLLNFAFLCALGPAGLAASKFARADAGRPIFRCSSDFLLPGVAAVILLTLLHVVLMTATRTLFRWAAMVFATIAAVGLVLSGSVDRLVAMAGFFYVVN